MSELDGLFAAVAQQRRGEMLFAEEMSKPDDEIDFVRAACFVAMHRRPDESRVEDALMELDELAAELERTLPPPEERFPLRTLKAISRFVFDDLGFVGDAENFYDPRNSCLDEVLARRKGIPITLSLVYMELARRVGVPMVGVNFPAHFMIRPVGVEDMEVLVDCFNRGELKFVEDVEETLRAHYGMAEGETLQIDRSFFEDEGVKPRAFFTRVLTNLKQIYFNREEYAAALQIVAFQSHCAPDARVAAYNRRDGGICLFLMKRYEEAIEELAGYLEDSAALLAEGGRGGGEGGGGEEVKAADRARVEQMIAAAREAAAREAARKIVEDAVDGDRDGDRDE